jgi:UDP-N-acetylmuramate dehydrogenase
VEERHRIAVSGIRGLSVRFDRPMRLHTTLRIGGKAEVFAGVKNLDALKELLSYAEAHGLPWIVLGKGSNLLVSDEGVDGLVIRLQGELAEVSVEGGGQTRLRAGGGAAIRSVLGACVREGLAGLEFLAGIPGTAGGAVAMNAGVPGREVGDCVARVEIMGRDGRALSADPGDLAFSYRSCDLPEGSIVTEVLFKVAAGVPEAVGKRIRGNLEVKRRTQPLSYPSAGSVFRNPPGDAAGRLVEKAGLKGKRVGGAEISGTHANFIINRGGATAEDVLSLMRSARNAVFNRTGIELEPEVSMVGFGAGAWPGRGPADPPGPVY